MKFIIPLAVLWVFLFASCAKEEVDGFDSKIAYTFDFKVDAATNDTFYRVYLPSAFTPNGDGVNDVYRAHGTGWNPEGFEMRIFSREGNLIYYSDDAYDSYDGRFQGASNLNAQQVLTVDLMITDTSSEVHRYNYKILQMY